MSVSKRLDGPESDDNKDDEQPTESKTDHELTDRERAELLAAENRRLREEYARARQSRYRSAAAGFAVVGLVALAAGVLFPSTREVLVALGGTGLFGAILTYYLTPVEFVAADVSERIYGAYATNGSAIVDELGLRETRFYRPADGSAQLYIPLHAVDGPPTDLDQNGPFVLDGNDRGLLFDPAGAFLFTEFERRLSDDFGSTPETITMQLCDGLVEQFELTERADYDVDPAGGRVTVRLTDSTFGALDRFDHPIPSFLATGLAVGLEQPIETEVDRGERSDWLVTCWFES
ncbi:hypothetical protein [Halopiger djelfimassiliensis]|uniref:hypothetical protein n=1 Tax=Halopiger djelfimassiliensis TaxID=1293047 RepID=UPI000677C5CA|nr:hypothetical protein [Halopiger djelfimassiliensis]